MVGASHDDGGEIRLLAGWFHENLGPDVPLHFTAIPSDFEMTESACAQCGLRVAAP